MSLNHLTDHLANQFQHLLLLSSNGEFRVLRSDDENAQDSRGFATDAMTPVLEDFHKCIWLERPVKDKEVSLAARASTVFEITIPFVVNDVEIEINSKNKLELRGYFANSTVKTLEIDSVINEQNISYRVIAMDLK